MARMRISLVAATATIAALAAPTTAAAAPTSCDGLQQAFNSSAPGGVVTLADDNPCVGHFNLPSHPITFEGGGTGAATLSGGDKVQIDRAESATLHGNTFTGNLAGDDDGGGGAAGGRRRPCSGSAGRVASRLTGLWPPSDTSRWVGFRSAGEPPSPSRR